MSAGQLPRWVDYGLIPFLNLAAAFLVSGLVVVLIGENPLDAVQLLVWGSIGYGEGIGFTLFYATNFIDTYRISLIQNASKNSFWIIEKGYKNIEIR